MVKDKPLEDTVYTDVDKVENRLDRELDIDNRELLGDAIKGAEEECDRFCNHAWRERRRVEVKERSFERRPRAGIPVYLDRMEVREVESLKVSTGYDVVDYISNSSYQEGRNKDFWINKIEGVIWIRNLQRFEKANWVEVTYTYGEDFVPHDIRVAAALMAAAEMIEGEGGSYMLPEGGDGVTLQSRSERFRSQAESKLSRHVYYTPVV